MHRFAAVLLFGVLGLAACGSGSGTGAPTAAGGTAAPASSAAASSAAAPSAAAPASSAAEPSGGDASAKDLCTFLEREVADLESVGSGVGALAQLASDLANWNEERGVKLSDAAQLDTLSQQGCPQVRARVLKALEAPSFDAAF